MSVRRFTNAEAGRRGKMVTMAVRVMPEIAEEMDRRVGQPGLPNRSAIIQDALARWVMAEQATEQERAS